jgi:hypothetical protein
MTLHDMIQADSLSVFANKDDFAEPVVYYKRTGKARSINAIIVRDALSILPEDGDTVTPVFEIHVANDVTLGIASDELDLGGDSIAFAVRIGERPTRRTILKLLAHDEGMLQLECR